MLITKTFNELNTQELYDILALREEIFIVEQNCPYHDIDYKDKDSIHIYKLGDNKIISYVRLLPKGLSYENSPSIGRVVTKKEYRGKGYSKLLLSEGIKYISKNFQEKTIEISAQEYLVDFYKSFGFKVEGESYLEDDIPHIHMILKLS